ncbi:MAG: xanthine dehydrogenase family protein molybdopterin-binding subunit [Acidimicrobiales bacterium]|nr:xanthine dehydrogenase family protein molybdopterin-binding subunit [Acidimicrobiales bacterium]MCB9393226.1 xanthine dehydrogenase family protein molybdopterin-binding subunit [Acidimicrobiaceae bacterium]
MAGSILGNRVLRKEDPKFLTTGGVYVDDLRDEPLLQGALHVTYVRSSVAHGRIVSIDTTDALAIPGVEAIYTAADLGLEPVPSDFNPMVTRGLLAIDKVRFVGEPVAVVLTSDPRVGEDAAEAVIVDYDVLPAVVDMEEALTSTTLIHEGAGSNVVFDTTVLGIPENSGEAFFAGCEVVVTGKFLNQRVAPCPLEVRGSAVAWSDGRLVQWLSTQAAQGAKATIAKANGVEPDQVLVIAPDVGGGFGAKISCDPEEALLGVISARIGKPLRWRETRSESMMVLGHGRAQVQYVTIGGSRDGTVTHYQLHVIQDAGYFAEMGTILAPFMTRPMASAVYAIPNIECRTTSVVTNTAVTTAYRGAGRPEATAAAERAMDLFAAEIGMDPAEVRRKNLIAKFDQPHTTVVGQTYDVGDYEGALDKALAAAGYTELRAEQAKRRASGDVKQLGIGVSVYVEITGGVGSGEHAKIEVLDDGRAIVYTGTSPHGQGHVTAWSMLAHEQTGIPMDRIDVVWGNTDLVPQGDGTMGSRSLQQGGNAVFLAAGDLVDKAKKVAARMLEADEADVVLDKDSGSFHVSGAPAIAKTWADLAVAAKGDPDLPEGLQHAAFYGVSGATFPFGAHVAVVEVDTETGQVRHLRHVACDDAGKVLNPMLLEGQIHGGVAQGTAQALLEEVRYDEDGNPITSNLADYAFISAAELPSIEVVHMETPTFINALGAKGIGESGTIGSTPAVQSAVIDAVSHLGVRHIDMPATAQKVWQAIAAAKG